jgi:hypothetical protein
VVVESLGTPTPVPNRARQALVAALQSLRAWLTPARGAQSGLAAPRVVPAPLSDAQQLARHLVDIFQNDELSPADAAEAVLALTTPERLTQRPSRAPTSASALTAALQQELRTAWDGGTLNPEAAARIADLLFQIRFNPTAAANAAPAVPLASLDADDQAPTLFTSWMSDETRARELIHSLLEGDNAGKPNRAVALGVHRDNAEPVLAVLRADPVVRALEAAGRLKFVIGDDTSNVLTLLDQSRDVRALAGLGRPRIQFLLAEGVALPPNFFRLSPEEWARLRADFVVHFVTRTLEAIPMEAGLLIDYQAFRMELTQA